MPRLKSTVLLDPGQVLVESYLVNDRMNQLILEHLDPHAWRAKHAGGKTRTIAAIFSHVHSTRRKWLRLSAPHLALPAPLDSARCTQEQAGVALAQSAACCGEMLTEALAAGGSRVKAFRRDGWASPWPAGASMLAYMIAHEAHHRGQACMLAHQLGFPISPHATYEMWAWEKLWKASGFGRPR